MDRRKEAMVNVAKKIIDDINAMSFVNLDDQQLHSLMMMREIARGVVDNKVDKVTKEDLKKTLSSSIEKMVGSCKDVNNILSKIPCKGMDEQQTQSVSRMKEIVSKIVTKRAKLTTTCHREIREPVELQIIQVNGADEETVDSKVGIKDIADEEIRRRLFDIEMHTQPTNDDSSSSQNTGMHTQPKNIDFSSSQTTSGAWMGSSVDFEALGIPNPPSWSVKLPDGLGGTKDVQVLKAPIGSVVEGLPLSSYLPEPHKSAFEYLLELIAALKHIISTGQETPSGAEKQ